MKNTFYILKIGTSVSVVDPNNKIIAKFCTIKPVTNYLQLKICFPWKFLVLSKPNYFLGGSKELFCRKIINCVPKLYSSFRNRR